MKSKTLKLCFFFVERSLRFLEIMLVTSRVLYFEFHNMCKIAVTLKGFKTFIRILFNTFSYRKIHL